MQIARIEIEAFGHLKDLTVELGESTLVLVQGANEAGKSTLFNFLVTMLYGFSPANQAQFPYVPWAGGRPAGAVEVVLDDGARYRIERNLASRPAGSLLRQGISKSLRNQTVPWVVSIPRALFGEIFMLTQEQMQVFGPRTWEQVGDQLVTGIGTSFLRPVTEVAEESAREARKLWREDRRRTRVRDLRERVKELQGQRSTLVTVQDELRGIQRQEEELRLQAKALREEREQLTAFLEEARLLKPVHEQLQRIEELSKTRWKEEVASLPQQIEEQFQGVTDQLRENERQQRELRSRIEQLAPLDPTLEQAMGLSEEIRALQKEEPFYAEQQRQLERLQEDLHRLDEKLKGTVESLAGPGDLVRRVTALEAGLLDAITARIRQLNADLEATSPPTMVLGWVSLGLAFLCILLGMSFSPWFYLAAAPLAGVSIARSLAWKEWYDRQAKLLQTQREEIIRLATLTGLPEDPLAEESTLARIEKLYNLCQERARLETAWQEANRALTAFSQRVNILGEKLWLSGPVFAQLQQMGELLSKGQEAQNQRLLQKRALEERLALLQDQHRTLATRKAQWQDVLLRIGQGDLSQGLAIASQAQKDLQACALLTQQLTQSYPDLDELRERVQRAVAAGLLSGERIKEAKDRLQAIEGDGGLLEQCKDRLADLAIKRAELERYPTLGEVDGEIAACLEELREATLLRDRLELVSAILLEAERRFRQKHQPSVMRIASEYLATITQGRYTQVFFEEGGSSPQLVVKRSDIYAPISITDLSCGTQDQVHFCLRLAIAEHLDEGQERLPVFLDEIFVNWDRSRILQALSLLEKISRQRQVFVFTCHDWLAELLAQRLVVYRLDLDKRVEHQRVEGSQAR